jgi:hypothetical protein
MCYTTGVRHTAVLLRAFAIVGLAVPSAACGTHDSSTPIASCPTVDASPCETPVPSYAKDIAPLFDRDCNHTCHAPDAGPWPLTDRQLVIDWTDPIVRDIEGCTMPPPDAGTLPISERKAILDWFACGAPDN